MSDVIDLTQADLDRGLTAEQAVRLSELLDIGALIGELWPGYRYAAEPAVQDSTEVIVADQEAVNV